MSGEQISKYLRNEHVGDHYEQKQRQGHYYSEICIGFWYTVLGLRTFQMMNVKYNDMHTKQVIAHTAQAKHL